MKKNYFNFENSQVGEGDIGIVSHIMTRLTMAKVLQNCNVDLSDFVFFREYNTTFEYYSAEERVNDISEFLDYFSADYSIDGGALIVNFPFIITGCEELLIEAFSYLWDNLCWFDEADIFTIQENQLIVQIEEYNGVPTKFFVTYFELMEGYIK